MKRLTFFFLISFLNLQSPALLGMTPAAEFKRVMKTVLESAASIQAQRAQVDAAEKNQSSKSLFWTPSAVSASVGRQFPDSSMTTNDLAASINLNLWKFGAQHLNFQAAKARTRAENARLGKAKEDIEVAASQLLFLTIRQVKTIEIQQSHLALKEDSFQVAKERYRQGQLASQELEKVKIDLESSRVSLAEAELAKIQTLNALKTLADVDPHLIEWPFSSEITKKRELKLRDPKNFYKVQADLADTEFSEQTARSQWRQAYMPSLDLTSGWSDQGLGSVKNGQWSSVLSLTIPLWDQLTAASLAASTAATAQASRSSYEQSLREAKLNINTLEQRLMLTETDVKSALRAAEKLQDLRNDSLRRFRLGRSTVNDLLIDENRYLDAESALLNSMQTYHELLVEICHDQGESILNCYDM